MNLLARCEEPSPKTPRLTCQERRGHHGEHAANDGQMWAGYGQKLCPATSPAFPTAICIRAEGHNALHMGADGREWPSARAERVQPPEQAFNAAGGAEIRWQPQSSPAGETQNRDYCGAQWWAPPGHPDAQTPAGFAVCALPPNHVGSHRDVWGDVWGGPARRIWHTLDDGCHQTPEHSILAAAHRDGLDQGDAQKTAAGSNYADALTRNHAEWYDVALQSYARGNHREAQTALAFAQYLVATIPDAEIDTEPPNLGLCGDTKPGGTSSTRCILGRGHDGPHASEHAWWPQRLCPHCGLTVYGDESAHRLCVEQAVLDAPFPYDAP